MTITHAYHRDFRAGKKWHVAPREWHSQYWPTQRDASEFVERTARSAEEFLLPLYMNRLLQGTSRVAGLFRDAAEFIKQWGVVGESLARPAIGEGLISAFAQAYGLDSRQFDWNDRLLVSFNAVRLADANGYSAERLLKHRRDAINTSCDDIATGSRTYLAIPADLRNAAIFVAYVNDFLAVESELAEMAAKIDNVKEHYPHRST
jgi:hypothetical protein